MRGKRFRLPDFAGKTREKRAKCAEKGLDYQILPYLSRDRGEYFGRVTKMPWCAQSLALLNVRMKINSVHTRGIAKISGFTRGVCKNLGDLILNLKDFSSKFLESRRS